jgi:hypothetical protein
VGCPTTPHLSGSPPQRPRVVASRMDPDAGADRTVMDRSLTALDVLLQVQAEAVQTGKQPYEIHGKWASQ